MTWTSPGTAVANTVITASFFNTNLRDDLNYLYTNLWYKISSLNGDGTNPIIFSSIPGTFTHLKFVGLLRSTAAATTDALAILVNAIASYKHEEFTVDGVQTTTSGDTGSGTDTAINISSAICGNTAPASTYSNFELLIQNYSNNANNKSYISRITRRINTVSTSNLLDLLSAGQILSTATITQVKFTATNINANSIITMYGLL